MKRFIPTSTAVLALILGLAVTASGQNKRPPHPSLTPVEDVEGLPRVLLIGDSISMGYTVPVRELLKGKANVHRPLTNCAHTAVGLASLDAWLETGGAGKKWDVIHFNWGLHDLKFVGPDGRTLADPEAPGSRRQISPEDYEKNLRQIVDRLEKTGASLIWCSTTPVPEGSSGRIAGDAAKYNLVAAKVMAEKSIPTDDLYAFANARLSEIQKPANVHFTDEGSAKLAEQVAREIEQALAKK